MAQIHWQNLEVKRTNYYDRLRLFNAMLDCESILFATNNGKVRIRIHSIGIEDGSGYKFILIGSTGRVSYKLFYNARTGRCTRLD